MKASELEVGLEVVWLRSGTRSDLPHAFCLDVKIVDDQLWSKKKFMGVSDKALSGGKVDGIPDPHGRMARVRYRGESEMLAPISSLFGPVSVWRPRIEDVVAASIRAAHEREAGHSKRLFKASAAKDALWAAGIPSNVTPNDNDSGFKIQIANETNLGKLIEALEKAT